MTANVPGDLLIMLCFGFNVLAGIFFFLSAKGKSAYEDLAIKSYHVFVVTALLAGAYLYYLFFSGNYQIAYVHSYSDRALPFFYKLSSFWGGQEGTYLLWLIFNAIFGYIIIKKAAQYRNYAMVIFSIVNLFFLFLMVKLSPFAMLDGVPADGSGLNPLLQDPWMVIHPPIMFLGYSMTSISFSIAMAALIMNDYSSWLRKIFPWAAITALLLAMGNILGGYWAYKTLGWGGYWAWDPVENSSFLPWFMSLALMHGLVIEKRTGAMRKSNILLTSLVFILVIYGTFLTRSGVLSDFSVHSFVDLGINQYLVGFLVLYIMMTVILFSKEYIIKLIGTYFLFHFLMQTFLNDILIIINLLFSIIGLSSSIEVFLIVYYIIAVAAFIFVFREIFKDKKYIKSSLIILFIYILLFALNRFFTFDNYLYFLPFLVDIRFLIIVYIVANILIVIPSRLDITSNDLNYNLYHKDFVVFAGLISLFIFSIIVLFWTSLPILTNIFSDQPRAADIATYNGFALPFAIIFSLLLTVAPFTTYLGYNLKNWQMKLVVTALATASIGFGLFYFILGTTIVFASVFTLVMTGFIMYLFNTMILKALIPSLIGFAVTVLISIFAGVDNYMYLMFFGFAAMVVVSHIQATIRYLPDNWRLAGAQIIHFGFGLMLIGILSSSGFSTNETLVINRGEAQSAYGLSIVYNGMQNDIRYPKNKLILNIEDNGSSYEANPQLYYSAKLDGIMRKPYVSKSVLYDLYFSPVEIKQTQEHNHIELYKEKTKVFGDYEFTFKGYSMGEHDAGGDMKVSALIELNNGGHIINLEPALIVIAGENGNSYQDVPAKFGENDKYSILIDELLIDKDGVAVLIPGLVENEGGVDRLVIDVSKKPIINFVWLGTTLMLIGSLIVFYRRKEEIDS